MLSHRLNKLEADLQFILAMQELLLENDMDINQLVPIKDLLLNELRSQYNVKDVPERDISNQGNSLNQHFPRIQNNCNSGSKNLTTNQRKIQNLKSFSSIKTGNHPEPIYLANNPEVEISSPRTFCEMGSTAIRITEDFEKEKRNLREEIDKEKRLRVEVEDSAKHVYIKLQKTEDELAREKGLKESLLMGTLKLKNLVHGYDAKIKELHKELSNSEVETRRLEAERKSFSIEFTALIERLKHLCHTLSFNNGNNDLTNPLFLRSEFDVKNAGECLAFIENHIKDLFHKSKSATSEENENMRKLKSQLHSVKGQYEKLEKELEELSKTHSQTQFREDDLKHKLHLAEIALTSTESELLKKQIELECSIQRLRTNSEIERGKNSAKLSEYCAAIRRSKDLLVALKRERDDSRQALRNSENAVQRLEGKLQTIESDKQTLMYQLKKLKKNINDEDQVKLGIQKERKKLEMDLKRLETEKLKCLELLGEMKHQLINERNKHTHEIAMINVEKEKILNEKQRLDENFRVLQKVSADQGQTIQKIRGDLEDMKKCNFRLESQIRDHECSESELIRKLEKCEKENKNYLRIIDDLEEKIESYANEMKQHDCDDFVDSKYKKKYHETEESFQRKSKEWLVSMREVEKERDDAVTSSRKTLDQIEEMKKSHNAEFSAAKSKFQSQVAQLLEQKKLQDSEKCAKIHELQSELDRVKLSSSQIQRALSMKVQQLQAALGICLGGVNQNNSNNNSTSGLGPGPLHQLHPRQQQQQQYQNPVAAFGNSVTGAAASAFNNCSDHSHHHSVPVNLLVTGDNVNSTQTPCLSGNSDCTSATFNQHSCSTTETFGIDFIGNLIL